MALSYSRLIRDELPTFGGGTLTVASNTTTSGSLVFVVVTTQASTITEASHFTAVSGNCSSLASLGAKYQSGSTTTCTEWYSATGSGSTGTTVLTYSSGITTVAAQAVMIYEVTGASGLTVLQSARASGSNGTASVTLSGAVTSGNECFYMAVWNSSNTATPGTGWTEQTDINFNSWHAYAQYHPTPSGSQNGAVTVSSVANVSIITEINNPSAPRGGGWGPIPIN